MNWIIYIKKEEKKEKLRICPYTIWFDFIFSFFLSFSIFCFLLLRLFIVVVYHFWFLNFCLTLPGLHPRQLSSFPSISRNITFLRTIRFTFPRRRTVSGVFSRSLFHSRLITLVFLPLLLSSLHLPSKHIFSKRQSSPAPVLSRFASIDRLCVVSQLTKSVFALRIHLWSMNSRSLQHEHIPITTMIIHVLDILLRNIFRLYVQSV